MKIGIRFAIATVSIILVVSIAANGYLYFSVNNRLSENDSLKKQIVEFQSEVTFLQNQTENLQTNVDTLQNNSGIDNQTIANLNAQILDLQTQIENMQKENDNLKSQISHLQNQTSSEIKVPNLVTALGATFTSGYVNDGKLLVHFLYIQGTVMNEGNGTAYNCDLKVISHTPSGSFTDYYRFTALAPGESANVDTHIFHDNIQSWEIFPECTNTP
jgi:cell division protein FtsB